MDDLLKDFLTETSESIAQVDVELVRLEKTPNDPNLLSSIFRLVHTIKGTCGFLGLPRLERVAHAGENILGKFRDGELPVTPLAVTLILKSIDTIKLLLAHLEQQQTEQPGSDDELIAELNAMADGRTQEVVPTAVTVESLLIPTVTSAAELEVDFVPVQVHYDEKGVVIENAPLKAEASVVTSSVTTIVSPKHEIRPAGEDLATKDSIANQSIRVDVRLLENLMTTVSELVLTRNQLLQILRGQKETDFTAPLQRLNQVTSELQESVMKTRMQPIGNAWSKLPRIIRDLSQELGKKIDLQMVGAETELDRQVLELIKDPLTHMVRNSADHGIETSADRLAMHKSEMGTIKLSAYHEGGHILIEISDDGRGLAIDKIKAKALQNGIVTETELAALTNQQIMQFIFKAGFSTAAKVTSVSGRGVGMDVVRTNIERIGGTVDLQSTEGKGSRFLIKIPLTLAIVSALIVECCNERFAIPQLNVVELVHASADSEHRVEKLNGMPVLRLRNRLLPLISLRRTLKLDGPEESINGLSFIVVVQVGGSTFGIIVDRVFDTEEIVVKPVSPILRDIPVFSGNTILGDGSVVMILDPNGITVEVGGIHSPVQNIDAATSAATLRSKKEGMQSILLFKTDDAAPKAVPLSLVARLEEIDCESIEYSDGKPIVQYRGKLMPLITLSGDYNIGKKGMQPVIVFTDDDRNMGILVSQIIDIVEQRITVDLSGQRLGYLGSAIISEEATDIVDVAHYVAQAFQSWFETEDDQSYGAAKERRVLLVDDSAFFRNLLTPVLTVAGYEVIAVDSPAEAFKLYEAGANFDVIVSDIEMPGTNGFEFAAIVKKEGRWSETPMLALSSHATPRDMDRGRQAGFTDYIGKFNREGILAALQNTINVGGAV